MPSVENRRVAVARSRSRGPGLVDRVLVTSDSLSAVTVDTAMAGVRRAGPGSAVVRVAALLLGIGGVRLAAGEELAGLLLGGVGVLGVFAAGALEIVRELGGTGFAFGIIESLGEDEAKTFLKEIKMASLLRG